MSDEEFDSAIDEEEPRDENDIEEGDYSKKSDFDKASIVQGAVQKVQETRSQEMKEGYFNILELPNGSIKKVYFPDTRQQYIGSVNYLKAVLSPEIRTNDNIKRFLVKFDKQKEELLNKYSVIRVTTNGNDIIELKEKYLPRVDEEFPIKILVNTGNGKNRTNIVFKRGLHNFNVRMYWDEMVELYDTLFCELNNLISEKNYFKRQTSY
jgi:hypothetical protein